MRLSRRQPGEEDEEDEDGPGGVLRRRGGQKEEAERVALAAAEEVVEGAELADRNAALIRNLKAALGEDDGAFASFREQSGRFRHGDMEAEPYCESFFELFRGNTQIEVGADVDAARGCVQGGALLLELIRLLPNPDQV
eukprot:1175884-Rhodomonas_salina.2